MKQIKKFKEFFLSSWAVGNRTTIYLLTFIIILMGVNTYNTLPKENFPEIQIPTFYVGTVYPGTSPEDMENLVTREIEQEINSIKGVKEISSNSKQDFSVVIVEFETNKDLDEAKREVQDAVDKAKSDLPSDLPQDPNVQEINFAEFPIMYLNIAGKDLVNVKKFADELEDRVEGLPEINRTEMVGALEREIQVNVDLYKAQMAGISFQDIESAISRENMIISGGEINTGTLDRSVRISGEFKDVNEIRNLVIQGQKGNNTYLNKIADVEDDFEERESFARLDGDPVITLNVIKKGGENLVEAADKIKKIVADMEEKLLPEGVKIKISGDQSYMTNNMLEELTNTIIFGFILVTIVLMFFMGLRDSLFVGLSVPLASFIAFILLPLVGFTLNLVVLFSFIFAMGIVVDNAIVVIENTHRILNEEGLPILQAAKKAAGEVIGPVFAGTLTTIAPFLPLAFWEGMVGEFMFFLPITIIITLTASLLVAYVINPVFAVSFMKSKKDESKTNLRRFIFNMGIVLILMIIAHFINASLRNLLIIFLILMPLYRFVIKPAIDFFQSRTIPWMMDAYRSVLRWSLTKNRPWLVLFGSVFLLIVAMGAVGSGNNKIVQFPQAEPNFVYIYNTFPLGTKVEYTDSVTKVIEEKVYDVIGKENPLVKSVITNVAVGAGDPREQDRSATPHKSRIQIEFVEYKKRNGVSTQKYLDDIRKNMKSVAGVSTITVEQEQNGPPTGKPVNIEVSSEDYIRLIEFSEELKDYLVEQDVDGVEELKWDLEKGKPEIIIDIDRVKASELGISTAQIGSEIRTAIYGKEASKYREGEDEFPIMIRLAREYRNDLSQVLSHRITYRNMADQGKIYEIPISTLVDVRYDETYGGINRLDLEKVITISSNILTGYDANEVVSNVQEKIEKFRETHDFSGIKVDMTGEIEEQRKTQAFLSNAMLMSMLFIILILVTQFNSIPKVLIIMTQIIFSMIGVLLGFGLTGMTISIVMTGVGIVSLAGIVVNNGILLLDFIDTMKARGYGTRDAIIEGGRVRFTPVLLTASSTILGLIPLAVAFNINFATLLSDFNPNIFFGGDNAVFWGPLSWTIIFGLGFATIVTLVLVPVLYYISYTSGIRIWRFRNRLSKKYLES